MESPEGTRWKAEQAEAWLRSVAKTARERDALRARAEAIRSAADGVRAIDYTRGGGSGGCHDGVAAMALEALESAARLGELAAEANERVVDARMRLRMLDDGDRMLLEMRYVGAMEWADVADAMGFTRDYCRGYLKRRALRAAYDAMPHHERTRVPRADCS